MKLNLLAISLLVCATSALQAAQPQDALPSLRAGASRIDYTPRTNPLPAGFKGVLDPIYVRSVVIDNGRTRVALVALDAGATPTDLYRKVSARAAAELNIPANQLLISASHTHSVPFRVDAGVEEVILRSASPSAVCSRPACPSGPAYRTST